MSRFEFVTVSPGRRPGERKGWIWTYWPKFGHQTDASVKAREALIPDPSAIRCRWVASVWDVAIWLTQCQKFASQFHLQADYTCCKQWIQVQFSCRRFYWKLWCGWVNAFIQPHMKYLNEVFKKKLVKFVSLGQNTLGHLPSPPGCFLFSKSFFGGLS